MIRICVLGTRGFPSVQGGVEKHCEELYPRLVRLGCDVTVFTRTPYIEEERRVTEWQGVKFVHLWCPKTKSLEAIVHTLLGIRGAKRLSPDILHIHSIGPSLLTPLAALSNNFKIVMTHHGPDYERAKWGWLAKGVLKRGERLGVTYSDGVIAISRWIKKLIKDKYKKEALFIPNGVSIPEPVPAGTELERWALEPGGYVFTACRFVPEKGLEDLILAYRNIKNLSFKLVIAGGADHETPYSRRIKRLAEETRGVVLTGILSGSRLAELFSNAELFVLPSYYEGLPIALLEALSYGVGVLVSDIEQHKEIPLERFRYFRTGDVNGLSDAIVECLERGISDRERLTYMGLLEREFDWDEIALKTLRLYETLLGKEAHAREAERVYRISSTR